MTSGASAASNLKTTSAASPARTKGAEKAATLASARPTPGLFAWLQPVGQSRASILILNSAEAKATEDGFSRASSFIDAVRSPYT